MSRRLRSAVFALGAAGLAFVLLWSFGGLPEFGEYAGPYGDVLNRVELGERRATNVVAAVVFDYRGLDTLGEALILFAAALAVALLLREVREEEARVHDRVRTEALRLLGFFAVPATVLLGLYVVAHGYVSPGGGFQGGVVLACGLLLIFLTLEHRGYRRAGPKALLDVGKGTGAAGYVAIGLVSLVLGHAFLESFLGPGTAGTLLSGGSFPLLNWASALEVTAAFALIFAEFIEEVEILRKEDAP